MENIDDIFVEVVYRDEHMDVVCKRKYTLREYTEMLRTDLMHLITDVEDLCYDFNGGKRKSDWTYESLEGFNKIKHKLLDKSGEIGRIPDNLIVKEKHSLTELVAKLAEEGE